MDPFHGWDSTVSRLQSNYEESLFLNTKFPGALGTHFIELKDRQG